MFDKDGKDDIDFTEFIIGCYDWQEIPIKKKLEFIFDMFDTKATGFISMTDILHVFGTLFINEGLEKNLALERTIEIFSLFTNDLDSKIRIYVYYHSGSAFRSKNRQKALFLSH